MKIRHGLIIKKAIEEWISKKSGSLDIKTKTIVCAATYFNWEVFIAAKVEGDTLKFVSTKLYPYLTPYQITKALMAIIGIDGSGICGSGVKRENSI
jgi:hypothetical protein